MVGRGADDGAILAEMMRKTAMKVDREGEARRISSGLRRSKKI